jgi:zinc protease
MPSGLRVIVEQDDAAKLVGAAWVIDTGIADDPPARPGLAHLVGHLLYTAPDATGVSTWRRLIDLGATESTKTEIDLTTAYAFAPRAALDELVAVLLSRAADPAQGLDQPLLEKERRVLDEELSLYTGGGQLGPRLAVNGLAGRTLWADPVALRGAIGAITLDDVRGFIAAHYRPERMTLVLSGALPPDWDRRFLAALPAGLGGSAAEHRPPVRRPLAPLVGTPPRPDIEAVVGDVRERELWLAWPVPTARGRDEVRLRMVAALADRLLARKIEAGVISDVTSGAFEVFSTASLRALLVRLDLRPDADPEHARTEARDVLGFFRALPIADWLREERRRANLDLQATRLSQAFAQESLESRTLGRARIAHDDPEQGVSDVLSAVIGSSLDSVAAVVSSDLSDPPASSILVTPRPGGRVPLGPSKLPALAPAGDLEDERVDDEPAAPHDARAVIETAQGIGARGARVSRLSNGLTLVVLPRPGLPVATMLLGFHADPSPGEGAVRPALRIARVLTIRRDPLEQAILQRTTLEDDGYLDTLEMFTSSANSAIDLLLSEAAQWRVEWPSPRGDAWLQRAAVREATTDVHLFRSLLTTLFGTHPYHLDDRTSSVREVTEGQLRAWVERVRRPANGVLVIVGDVDAAAIAAEAEDTLSDWTADASPPSPPPAPPAVVAAAKAPPLLSGVDPGLAWTKLQFGCFLPPAASARQDVVGELFANALGDELFRRLRVERAVSFAPTLNRYVLRGGTHALVGTIDVDPKAGSAALDFLRGWLDPAATTGLDAAALERARWRLARRSGLRDATNGAIAHRLYHAWNMGWPLASLDDYPRDLASVTPAEVAAALASCRASAVISFLGPS